MERIDPQYDFQRCVVNSVEISESEITRRMRLFYLGGITIEIFDVRGHPGLLE